MGSLQAHALIDDPGGRPVRDASSVWGWRPAAEV